MNSVRVGIDVGGTHTDAAALDQSNRIVAWTKCPTTADVQGGIENALAGVLTQMGDEWNVSHVLLGTTHGINAILQRRGLCKVATIRLGAPATLSIPPLISWPRELREAISVGEKVFAGGNYYEGEPISKLDPRAIRAFLDEHAEKADAFAVTGVFSPAYRDQELAVADIVKDHLGGEARVSLSHEIGSLGLLARENATVLNAALIGVAETAITGLKAAMRRRGIDAPTYFAQNDGTLMGVEYAGRYPVMTIGSGPSNSIRGAAFLTGLSEAVVADVGGTTTDFGVLVDGFPREAAKGSMIAGVRTNFRMPDILSLSIGGGTIVAESEDGVSVGPESLGHELDQQGWGFGGVITTLTDAAVAVGRSDLTARERTPEIGRLLREAMAVADVRLSDAIETMNLAQGHDVLVVVGGGGFLIADSQPHVKRVIRPEAAQIANAVGVAVAPVSARWDAIIGAGEDRRRAIENAQEIAVSRAVQAGADPRGVEIVELEEVALNYLARPASRLRVRAAGPLGALA